MLIHGKLTPSQYANLSSILDKTPYIYRYCNGKNFSAKGKLATKYDTHRVRWTRINSFIYYYYLNGIVFYNE